jgi:uncharacterized protein YkwD
VPASLADGRVPFVRFAVSAAILAVLLLVSAMDASAAKRTARASASFDSVESEVIRRVNGIRQANGLSNLRSNHDLGDAAESHSRGMIASGQFSHDSADGTRCDVRIRRFVKARVVGETLAWIAGTPAAQQAARTVELWMNSPPHKATLLTPSFRRIGVSRKGGTMFGRRGVAVTLDLAG